MSQKYELLEGDLCRYFTHEHNSHPRKYNPKTAEQMIATLRGKGKPNTDLEWRHFREIYFQQRIQIGERCELAPTPTPQVQFSSQKFRFPTKSELYMMGGVSPFFMFKIRTAGLIGLPVTRFYTVLVCLVNIVKKFEINLCWISSCAELSVLRIDGKPKQDHLTLNVAPVIKQSP